MFDKYSFKEPENTSNLAKQITKNEFKSIQISIQNRKKKQSKIIKNNKNRQKSPPDRHLAAVRAPGGAKLL